MKKILVTQAEWDKIADDFAERNAGKTRGFGQAMQMITEYMEKYKIIK